MKTLIRADRLIDGTGAAPLENAALVIEGGTIAAVVRSDTPASLVPDDAERIEIRGGTILPGLIDTHVHLNLPGDGTLLEDAVREPDGVLVATSAWCAGRALAAGITTVRDVGGARSTVFDVKRALSLGYGQGARILACGQPITITGGHTWYFGGEADGERGAAQQSAGDGKAWRRLHQGDGERGRHGQHNVLAAVVQSRGTRRFGRRGASAGTEDYRALPLRGRDGLRGRCGVRPDRAWRLFGGP